MVTHPASRKSRGKRENIMWTTCLNSKSAHADLIRLLLPWKSVYESLGKLTVPTGTQFCNTSKLMAAPFERWLCASAARVPAKPPAQAKNSWGNRARQNITPHARKQKLVGGIPTPLKNMSSSLGAIIPNTWKHKMFQTTNQKIQLRENYMCCQTCWNIKTPSCTPHPDDFLQDKTT